MIDVKALPIVDAFTTDGQPLVAILGPNHEVYWEAVKKMEGILPLIFESRKGGPLKEYQIYGNTPYQEWTPSPEKERTANLLDIPQHASGESQGGYIFNKAIDLPSGYYTISYTKTDRTPSVAVVDKNGNTYFNTGINTPYTFNADNGIKEIRVFVGTDKTIDDFMLNEGSTALPYEPYGYREKTGPCEIQGVGERTGNLFDEVKTDTTLMRFENGKAISSGRATICDYFLKAGAYTICIKSNISSVYLREGKVTSGFFARLNIGNNTVTFTFDSDKYLRISAYSDNTGEVMYEDIMLNEGSEPLPYEPYGYKTTLIDSVRNLWNPETYKSCNLANSGFFNTGGSGKCAVLPCTPNTRYTISFTENATPTGIFRISTGDEGFGYTNNYPITDIFKYSGLVKKTFTTNTNARYIIVQFGSEAYDDIVIKTQLELGDTATPYVPYREPIETTIYHDEPYFTNDYIRKDKDGGVEHREWAVAVLKGDESINSFKGDNAYRYAINYLQPFGTNAYPMYCSHFKYIGSNLQGGKNGELSTSGGTNFRVWLWSDVYTTDESFKAFLKSEYDAGHPVRIYYPLATLTDTQKDLPDIVTASGYNSIDTDTQIKPEKMEIAYR